MECLPLVEGKGRQERRGESGELLTHRSEQQPGFSEQGVAQSSFLTEPGGMCQL